MTATVQDAFEGEKIAGYTVGEKLGEGAFGRVYRCQRGDGAALALKLVDGSARLERVLVEPQILSRLEHPNIVKLQDYFLHHGRLVLVMDRIGEGETLEELLDRRERCSTGEVRAFLVQVASALSHAHALGVMHGDLKPANVLVEPGLEGPRFVLADFGVGRMLSGIQTRPRVAGTYAYMAPEQIRGRAQTQSDLWALGVVAYLMLVGRRPFQRDDSLDLARSVCYDPHEPPVVGKDGDDHTLMDVIDGLLEKDLSNRMLADEVLRRLGAETFAGEVVSAPQRASSWEKDATQIINWNVFVLIVAIAIGIIPYGILQSVLQLGGLLLIATGQERRWRGITTLGIVLLIGTLMAVCGGVEVLTWNPAGQDFWLKDDTIPLHNLLGLCSGYFTATSFSKIRSKQRDLLLVRTVRQLGVQGDDALEILAQYLSVHHGDLRIHSRYAETLLSRGRPLDAAVEAKLMLTIDPYSYAATLLLAESYLQLGLLEECRAVCNGYLVTSGQCFEFAELIRRSEISLEESPCDTASATSWACSEEASGPTVKAISTSRKRP